MRLYGCHVRYFTTKQASMTKRLAACNPIVSQTYRPGAIASLTSCCVLLRRSEVAFWPPVIVCVYLYQFAARHCSLLHLRCFNTAAYRFTLSTVLVPAREIPARVKCDKLRACRHRICLPWSPEQFNRVSTVPPAHPVSLRYPLIILHTVERFDEWRKTHSKRSMRKTSWPKPR